MSTEKHILICAPSNDAIETRQFDSFDAARNEMLEQLAEQYLADGGVPAVWDVAKGGEVFEGERMGFWVDDPEYANARFARTDGTTYRWLIRTVSLE